MMNTFDSGTLFYIPPDGTGARRIGAVQGVTLTYDMATKDVRTQYQMPVKFTQTLQGIDGVAQFAKIDGQAFAELAYGTAATAGARVVAQDVPFTPSVGTPSYAAALPTGATFALDLGVFYASTGAPLALTTGTVAAGQYKVTGSTYAFAVADQGKALYISYAYDATTGKKISVTNTWTRMAPTLALLLTTTFNGKQASLWLPSVNVNQMLLPMKLEQYEITEMAFNVCQDGSGSIGIFSFAE